MPKSANRFALRYALGVFLLASFLPIWVAWHITSWEAVGYPHVFWAVVATVASGSAHASRWELIWYWHGWNWVEAAAILGTGFALGKQVFRMRCEHLAEESLRKGGAGQTPV